MSFKALDHGTVMVLLSTYNGSQYLQQQLDSLYQQTYPNVRILVRDDGSRDSTRGILQQAQVDGYLILLKGHSNLGVASSFFTLLKAAATSNAEFVAFCDQDDVWHADKISRAVSRLTNVSQNRPAMYCSRVEIVDKDLKHIGYTSIPRKIGFGNALVECVTTGCTIVLNAAAVQLLSKNLPNSGVMHDWWCYLVMACFGEVIYDPVATLKYRQHGANTIGLAANGVAQLTRRWQRFFGGGGEHLRMSAQAAHLLTIFNGRMPCQYRRVLDEFLTAKLSRYSRIKLTYSSNIWRQQWVDNFLLRLLILLNRF